jgi:transmembrane sensor
MERKVTTTFNDQIYQEACEWFVQFRSQDLDTTGHRRFDTWARQSPEHLAAYLEIAAIWKDGTALCQTVTSDTAALIAHALTDVSNVMVLSGQPDTRHEVDIPTRASPRSGRIPCAELRWYSRTASGAWFKSAAFAATIVLMVGGAAWYWNGRMPTYATTFGEQRSIILDDGSVVDINSHSKIRVRYSATERDVELLEGQALFRVAKNAARPFWVSSETTRVRAVGTEFDVYNRRDGTVVSVVEGRVAVLMNSEIVSVGTAKVGSEERSDRGRASNLGTGDDASIVISAGEQVLVTPLAIQKFAHPNIMIATAWTQRELAFESASLSEVAEEFNRYNRRQLVIDDPALYDFHITGVFSSGDPASLVRFLRERPGVRVTETPSEIRVSKIMSY